MLGIAESRTTSMMVLEKKEDDFIIFDSLPLVQKLPMKYHILTNILFYDFYKYVYLFVNITVDMLKSSVYRRLYFIV